MSDAIRLFCENGHLNLFIFKYSKGRKTPICKICGAQTYSECPNCGERIEIPNEIQQNEYIFLMKCEKCGKDFPWAAQLEDKAKALMERSLLTKENARKTVESLAAQAKAKEQLTKRKLEQQAKQQEIQKSLKLLEQTRAEQANQMKGKAYHASDLKRKSKVIKVKGQPNLSKENQRHKAQSTKRYKAKHQGSGIFAVVIPIIILFIIVFAYSRMSQQPQQEYGETVYVSRTGIIHKDSNCCGMIHYREMSDSEAHKVGHRECKICY